MMRSKIEMAAVLTVLDESRTGSLTRDQIADITNLGACADRAIHHLREEGWITSAGKDRIKVVPDQTKRPSVH